MNFNTMYEFKKLDMFLGTEPEYQSGCCDKGMLPKKLDTSSLKNLNTRYTVSLNRETKKVNYRMHENVQ